jgi:hypothetical protein
MRRVPVAALFPRPARDIHLYQTSDHHDVKFSNKPFIMNVSASSQSLRRPPTAAPHCAIHHVQLAPCSRNTSACLAGYSNDLLLSPFRGVSHSFQSGICRPAWQRLLATLGNLVARHDTSHRGSVARLAKMAMPSSSRFEPSWRPCWFFSATIWHCLEDCGAGLSCLTHGELVFCQR